MTGAPHRRSARFAGPAGLLWRRGGERVHHPPSSATTSSGPGTTAESTATSGSVAAPEAVVWQILQRWDGALSLGSFEATICNLGQEPATGLEAVIAAKGVEARVSLQSVPARGCVDAFDPASSFEDFGASAGQAVSVRATVLDAGVEVASREETITVDLLSAAPAPELLEACVGGDQPVAYCTPAGTPAAFADPHEVMKQHER